MTKLYSVEELRAWRRQDNPSSLGFVPTMGALHEGHGSLIRRSVAENERTLVSIYLNPAQFDNDADLDKYPEDLEGDIKLLEDWEADAVFLPDYQVVYPDKYRYVLSEKELSGILCGASRPGHFDGVLTVVMKLFMMVGPCRAYFGEKDYQQYLLIRDMAEAFFMPVEVIPCPLVRQEDGLALSSRNKRLSDRGREIAPDFHRILSKNIPLEQMRRELEKTGFKVDYLEQHFGKVFGAVFLEEVRLIDHV